MAAPFFSITTRRSSDRLRIFREAQRRLTELNKSAGFPHFLADRQSVVVLFSSPRCRKEFCTQLAHYFVRGHGFVVELGMLSFTSEKRVSRYESAGV